MSTRLIQARSACDGDSFMSSTERRCIHSFQSSFVTTCDTSHACFKCCWLTVIFVDSAGAENSGALYASSRLDLMFKKDQKQKRNILQWVEDIRILREAFPIQKFRDKFFILLMVDFVPQKRLHNQS